MSMRSFYTSILLFLFFALSQGSLLAQENTCESKLAEAKEKYDAGLVQEVPGLLSDCLEEGFSSEERLQAYKLLINAYIFDDNLRQAQSTMLVFLKTFPGYKATKDDTPEFTNLLEQYDNRPRGTLGFFGGTNMSLVRVREPFGVQNINTTTGEYTSGSPSFQVGLLYHLFITPKLEIGLEPVFTGTNYSYKVSPYTYTDVTYDEKQTRVDLPLTLTYCFGERNVRPYFLVGGSASMLLSARGNITRTFHNTGDLNIRPISENDVDVTDRRNIFEAGAMVGGGLRFKIKKSYIFFDVRYNAGLGSQVKGSSRNNTMDEFTWRYYYIPDNFSIDNISLRLGLAKTLYHPRPK